MKFIVLIAMLYCHIIDDFKLQQGVLAKLKQKSWWKKNAPDKLYENDWFAALEAHAFCWTCSIHIPVLVYCILCHYEIPMIVWFIAFTANVIIHAVVDHLKANLFRINLMQDQLIHIVQIWVTWFIYLIIV